MKLHGYFRSSTSYRLRIALELKGLDYENVPVNLLTSEQKDAEYVSHNPFGSVPLLQADGRDRAQSMAQIEWLDEAYPERPLLPADIEDRFTTRELTYAIATELHAPLNLPVLKYLKNEYGKSQDEIDTWYRHWLARTLDPVEERLAQVGADDFPNSIMRGGSIMTSRAARISPKLRPLVWLYLSFSAPILTIRSTIPKGKIHEACNTQRRHARRETGGGFQGPHPLLRCRLYRADYANGLG